MKLKGLLIALVAGPVAAYIASQVLWFVYGVASLNSFLSVSNYSDLTTAVFGVSWLGIAYAGLKKGKQAKTKTKAKKYKLPLDKEFTLKDVSETFRPSIKNAVLEFIIIGNGKNLHQIVPYDKAAEYTSGEQTYKISNENLLVQKPILFGKTKLTAIFHSDGKPVKIEGDNGVKVTAEILSLAQRSGALGRTIKELFSSHLDLKKILFFVVIGIVAVVAVLIISGGFF